MTSTTFLALPLTLLVLWLPRVWALPAILVSTSLFADAAIANPGDRPILVGWFLAVLLTGRMLCAILLGRSSLRVDVLRRLLPLVIFILVCVTCLLLALAFFQGRITVLPGSAELNPLFAQPYHLTSENLNQLAYLLLIFAFVYTVTHIGAETPDEELTRWVDRAMRWSAGGAAVIVVWQLGWASFGVWYPSDFFHSSVHALAWDQGIAGVPRPSGPFPEPSVLGYFYTMYLFYFWQRWRRTGRLSDCLYYLMCVVMMVLSTSTTAYLLVGLFVILAAIDWIAARFLGSAPVRPGRPGPFLIRSTHVVVALCFLGSILGGFLLAQRYERTVLTVVADQIANKDSSQSYALRSNADAMGLHVFLDTYGLGAGLGSHRSSSGLLTLLAGSGLVGALAFSWLLAGVLRDPLRKVERAETCKALRWALLGLLGCHLLTVPEFQSIPLWTCVSLLMGMELAGSRSAAAASPQTGPPDLAFESSMILASVAHSSVLGRSGDVLHGRAVRSARSSHQS